MAELAAGATGGVAVSVGLRPPFGAAMAPLVYTFAQFSADLALFGYAKAEEVTLVGLKKRHRTRVEKVHPDRPGGQSDATRDLNTARDRLHEWHQAGRYRFADQPRPQPGYADTAAAAAAREAQREKDRKAQEDLEAELKRRREQAEREKAILEAKIEISRLKRQIWGHRALMPLRGLNWIFIHIPTDRLPVVVVVLLFVFGYPFLQESSLGRYVPHFPSVYDWVRSTEAYGTLTGRRHPWIGRTGFLGLWGCRYSDYDHPNAALARNNGLPYYDRPYYWDDDAPEEKAMDAMARAGEKWDPITRTFVFADRDRTC